MSLVKFEVGESYFARLYNDEHKISTVKILSRTEKSVTFQGLYNEKNLIRKKIYIYDRYGEYYEYILTIDRYYKDTLINATDKVK